jgi:hypothetical protein
LDTSGVTANFASSNPGTWPVTVSGLTLTGSAAGNYSLVQPTGLTGTITPAQLIPTTTTLSLSSTQTVAGQIATVTATVTPASSTSLKPTGTVTFLVDNSVFRTVSLDPATGKASFSTALVPFGVHSLTAVYSGDTNFASSQTTAGTTLAVTLAGTNTTVTTQAGRNRHGQFAINVVTHVVVAAPGSGTPTGTVTYYLNGRRMKTVPLNNGMAVWQQAPVVLVYRYVYALYNGDSNFQQSVSQGRTVFLPRTTHKAGAKIARPAARVPAGPEALGRTHGPLARPGAHRHPGRPQSS